jgi:hypothetical protein
MDRLKFNKMKKSKKRRQICLKDGVELKKRSLLILYFEFEFRKHHTVLLRGMRKDSMKVSKCLFDMLTIKERYKFTNLCAYFSDCFSVCVGSSDNHLTSALTACFWGWIFIPPHPLLHFLLT